MATQISCGATDCENNSNSRNPQCTLDVLRIANGKIGGAICFQYTNAPLGQKSMHGKTSRPSNVDKALYS
jgi:hypothetical protein